MIEQIPLEIFKQELQKKTEGRRIPFEATLEITYGCNLNCVHCYNPTHQALPQEVSTEILNGIIDQLAELGCLTLTVSGGEMFTRPDVWDILSYTKKSGFQLNLFTNATLLNEEKIRRIQALGPNLVSVSVYGISQSVYEEVTRVPGSYAHFMSAVDLLKESGLPLLFKMPVMTLNRHEREAAYEWFSSRGLSFIHSAEIHPRVDGDRSPLLYRLPPAETAALRMAYEEPLSCRQPSYDPETSRQVFTCSCGKKSLAVTPYGEMNLCTTTYYPRYQISSGNVRQGWKILVDFVESFKPSENFECTHCEFSSHCSQGAMDAFLNTGDFNRCVPYFKETAREVKKMAEASS